MIIRNLLIGAGEVGQAIGEVLNIPKDFRHDPAAGLCAEFIPEYEFAHVAIPYTAKFEDSVRRYQNLFKIRTTVIHSTVPVGTCDRLGAVHSPIRGVHPRLAESMRLFIKHFAGRGAIKAAEEFIAAGVPTTIVSTTSARDTEAMKLWETAQYGLFIALEKEIYRWCEEHGVDFDLVYRESNETYNAGYEALGMHNVRRPILKHVPGPIGGHCVVPNARLMDSWVADIIKRNGEQ